MSTTEQLYAKLKGISEDEAKAAVASLREKVKDKMPGKSSEQIEEALYMKISISGKDTGEKANLIMLALASPRDVNLPRKKGALKKYEDNPQSALKEKVVRLDSDGNPVAIDGREFFGNDRKNHNYLKDIEEDIKVEGFALVKDEKTGTVECAPVQGKFFNASPGQTGKMSGRLMRDENQAVSKIIIYKDKWMPESSLDQTELWDTAYEVLGDSQLSVPIEAVFEKESNTPVAVKGKVTSAKLTKDGEGGAMIAITDIGLDEDVVGFADQTNEVIKSQIDLLPRGTEIIMFGTVNKYTGKDDKEFKNINLIGFIVNPASTELAGALGALDDIDI